MARDAKARDLEIVLLGDPSTPAPATAGGLCSGFRSMSGTKGATGLPVGLHIFDLIRSEQWIKTKVRPSYEAKPRKTIYADWKRDCINITVK